MKAKNLKNQQVAAGFIKYLEKSGQISQLSELANIQQKQSWMKEKQDSAQVTSCVKLNLAEVKTVTDFLQKKFNPTMKITFQVDQQILGGIVIRVGNKIIDASLQHRLEKLKEALIYA